MFELVPATPSLSGSQSAYIVRNLILATLPEADFALLRPHLRRVSLRRNDILHDAFRCPDAVYFVESGLISRVVRSPKDGAVEVANVGRCGFIGVSVVLGTMIAIQRTVVLVPGQALGIEAETLRGLMVERPSIKEHLLKYVQVLMALKAQIAMCNAKHELSERLARWLLLAHDMIESDVLPVTHGLLADALGVRRPGVSVALAQLEAQGIVARTRGALRILDLDGLRRSGCECHQVVRDRFRPFSGMPDHQHSL
ncbi:Cyclic nucleotide-binding domain (CNMP-BD) protein [Bradyrhizobium sp. STM 3843]|uniref:Crp/Fnr family transcriptional regulator n=1 Tax=Bradyrhizobium sp. HKCCYLS1011 TaxID=3420733 RepID=UPI0002403217|nr:Cyclic nucleotide-binding domain (CNMP-BD) protein [Bradyrhizobium sp. STM 3843]